MRLQEIGSLSRSLQPAGILVPVWLPQGSSDFNYRLARKVPPTPDPVKPPALPAGAARGRPNPALQDRAFHIAADGRPKGAGESTGLHREMEDPVFLETEALHPWGRCQIAHHAHTSQHPQQ